VVLGDIMLDVCMSRLHGVFAVPDKRIPFVSSAANKHGP
jgi:hypothetical protein